MTTGTRSDAPQALDEGQRPSRPGSRATRRARSGRPTTTSPTPCSRTSAATAWASLRGPTDFRVTRPEASVPVSSERATPIRTSPTSRAMTRTYGQYSVRLRCLDTPGGALQSSDANPGGLPLSEPKYRILHELGAGGMGTVRKGLLLGQAGFQRPIVVKQLKTPEPEHLRLFVEEARRYAVLDHENIGRIFDFERVDGELCIVLEYIDGWSLVEYLERHREPRLPARRRALRLHREPGVPRPAVRVREGPHRAPRREPEQRDDDDRGHGQADRLRHRRAQRHPRELPGRQALVHGARDGGRDAGRPAQRHLLPRRGALRDADRRAALHRATPRRRCWRRSWPATSRRRPRSTRRCRRRSRPSSPAPSSARPAAASSRPRRMGEACEHFLYDKGYGPTNLTLKHYLASIFGRGMENESAAERPLARADAHPAPRRDAAAPRTAEPTRVVSPAQEGDRPRGDAAARRGQDRRRARRAERGRPRPRATSGRASGPRPPRSRDRQQRQQRGSRGRRARGRRARASAGRGPSRASQPPASPPRWAQLSTPGMTKPKSSIVRARLFACWPMMRAAPAAPVVEERPDQAEDRRRGADGEAGAPEEARQEGQEGPGEAARQEPGDRGDGVDDHGPPGAVEPRGRRARGRAPTSC